MVKPSSDATSEAARPVSRLRLAALVAGPLASFLLLLLPAPEGMTPEAWRLVAMTTWMVIWWLCEAVPMGATALLPIILMPLYGIEGIGKVTRDYGHPIIFLFLGGFLLAVAMQRVGLHRRIALKIVAAIGSSPRRIVLGFMVATAFLSMWITNTASTILMFAVALSVISFIRDRTESPEEAKLFALALLLGIAYSASIGGLGTLIGTAPNGLLVSVLSGEYGIRIGFFDWMKIGVPVIFVMLPITWLLLTFVLFRLGDMHFGDLGQVIRDEQRALGAMSRGETLVAVVFALTAIGWIFRVPLASLSGLPISDTAIAIAAAMALFAIPISRSERSYALDRKAFVELPWDVLLLVGGGLALADGFGSTGLAAWIADSVAQIEVSTWVLILLATTVIVYMTEITSNTASTATFLPILAAVAVGLGLDPRVLAIPVTLGASMAFMMPVATPPNAIVFSYEDMHLRDMVRAGLWLNVVAIAVCFAAGLLLVPLLVAG